MKNFIIMLYTLALITFFISYASNCLANKWIQNDVNVDCKTVCGTNKYSPIISGKYENKYEFYVCAYNIDNRGFRAGFNREGQSTCSVGSGGDAHRSRNKFCLCDFPDIKFIWIGSSKYDDFKSACIGEGMIPVNTGKYVGGGFFYVCSTNAWKRGFRTGYNLQGTRNCVAGSGGDSVWGSDEKRCLCAEQEYKQ